MIPYGRHSINDADISAVTKVLQSDWLTIGPRVEEFEFALEKIAGAPCISVTSGTAALHCAYAAIELKSGDEVITPPITFIATQATAAQFGAKIVFADVLSDTATIDPKAVEAAITSRTKAIVAVDYAGHPADLDELRILADKYKIYLIEDAAHSIGSTYKGRPTGSIADITTFSFFPTKNLTTGEGGAVASVHPELLKKAKRFSRQGMVKEADKFLIQNEGSWHQEVHSFGLNYRLPDLLCALGISQLERIESFKKKRTYLYTLYQNSLSAYEGIQLPSVRSFVDPMWHLFAIQVDRNRRRQIFESLRQAGIGVQVNYIPAYWHPVFPPDKYPRGLCPNAENFYSRQISLPIHYELTQADVDFIVEQLTRLVSKWG